jgi:hypothetical protein
VPQRSQSDNDQKNALPQGFGQLDGEMQVVANAKSKSTQEEFKAEQRRRPSDQRQNPKDERRRGLRVQQKVAGVSSQRKESMVA